MSGPRYDTVPATKMTKAEVQAWIGHLALTVPPEINLTDALGMFLEQFPDLTDRITIQQQGDMLGLWAIVAKYAAAHDAAASTQIVIGKESRQ